MISFNDNCSFLFITAFFVVNTTVIVIIKRISKVSVSVFCSGHENLSSNGISSPPDGTGDGRYLVYITDITIYKTTFSLDKIINMTRNFSRDMSHRFPELKMYFSQGSHMHKDQRSLKACWFLKSSLTLPPSLTLFQVVSLKTWYPRVAIFTLKEYLVEDALPTRVLIQYEFFLLVYSGTFRTHVLPIINIRNIR